MRPVAREAWRCYSAGAARASIAMTWSAITADITTKLLYLADEGDLNAQAFRAKVEAAQALGLSTPGVKNMQGIENDLLNKAVEFELIDSTELLVLQRIREDRNLCVHPSLRPGGQLYSPATEVARAHLVIALDALLLHPPTQGGKLMVRFQDYFCDPQFVKSSAHIQSTFFDRVRLTTRQQIVRFAARFAITEDDPGGRLPATLFADRMAVALAAFAERDRTLVVDAVKHNAARLHPLDTAVLWRCMTRLGEHDYFWNVVDDPLRDRLAQLVESWAGPTAPYALDAEIIAGVAVVRHQLARAAIPQLETNFQALTWNNRLKVVAGAPHAYFLPAIAELLGGSISWNQSEHVAAALLAHADFLTVETLEKVLNEWQNNDECVFAGAMPDFAAVLYQVTDFLGVSRIPTFVQFQQAVVANAQSKTVVERHYYRLLEGSLISAGALQTSATYMPRIPLPPPGPPPAPLTVGTP